MRATLVAPASLAAGLALALGGAPAHAGECAPHDPACHLEQGKELLASDPERAAAELLASYRLDERTDTLALYATALERAEHPAHALETWKRVIVFREAELGAAKERLRKARGRKRAAAKRAIARAQRLTERAAEAVIELWPKVARVRVRLAKPAKVTRGGVEVDATRDVLVDAGRDELVFAYPDGTSATLVVEVAGGAFAELDAPAPRAEPERTPVPAPAPEAAPAIDLTRERPERARVRFVEEPRSRTLSRVGLGLVAGAVVLGGVAGGFGYLADRDYNDALGAGCSADGLCPVGPAADLARRSNDRARYAQLAAIGGGAALVTGVALWIVGRGKVRRELPAVTLHVGPSSAGFAWRF